MTFAPARKGAVDRSLRYRTPPRSTIRVDCASSAIRQAPEVECLPGRIASDAKTLAAVGIARRSGLMDFYGVALRKRTAYRIGASLAEGYAGLCEARRVRLW